MAASDVDGDADLDLVFGNHSSRDRLYLNDGTGRFTDATATKLPLETDRTLAVAMHDVDRDGDPDLLTGNYQGQPSKLYLNDGTGTFANATGTNMPRTAGSTFAIALGDVDGDGDGDAVFANLDQNELLANDGTGVFVDAATHRLPIEHELTTCMAFGDVDGDRDLDVVFGNTALYSGQPGRQNLLYLNDGDGFFVDATATHMPPDTDLTDAIAFGDVDGDADLDMVVGNRGMDRLYLNDGTGRFHDATAGRLPPNSDWTRDLELGDLDGDGDLDLLVANYSRPVRMYHNDGTGVFHEVTLPPRAAVALALSDVDADGDLDLVLGSLAPLYNFESTTRLYLNDGAGRYTEVTGRQMPASPSSALDIAIGDVDGDGDGDIVVGEEGYWIPGGNKLYVNDGGGRFTDVSATNMPSFTSRSVAMGDVDEDGDQDLVFGSGKLLLNAGNGVFSVAPTSRMAATRSGGDVELVDVDRDRDLDLVGTRQRNPNQLFLNVLRQLDTPFPTLRPGAEYRLDFYDRYGFAGERDDAYPLLSTAPAHIPLAPFGTLLISPLGMAVLPPVRIHAPTGIGSLSLTVPNVPSIIGVPLHAQALIAQLASARLTNAALDVIQP